MLSNAKKAWHIALAFVLATALSLPSLAFGLDGKGDTSSAADGTMSVYVEDQAGNTALMKSYTADEFAALAAEVDAGWRLTGSVISVTIKAPAGMSVKGISDCVVSGDETQYWTGSTITPITVSDKEGNLLSEGTDYTIEYANNVNAGIASYTISGAGAYVGQLKGTFTITDKILNVQLNGKTVKSYTAADLKSKLSTDTQYYQQSNHGKIVGYAATDYITFADLLDDAGIGQYWTAGSNLQFICTDGLYKKNQPTYEDVAEQNLLYPNQTPTDENNTTDAVEVPAILAFTYGQANSDGATVLDAAKSAASAMNKHATAKVFRGWKATDGEISAPGWRLATGVVNVNLQTTHASKLFGDVEEGAWYEEAVTFCNFNKLMTGYAGTDTFGVGKSLTRAEFATVLYRIADPTGAAVDPTTVKNTTKFSDVEDGQFYTAAANWAVANGVIQGVDDAAFKPNTPVSREMVCTILARYMKAADGQSTAKLNSMPDAASVSDWAANSVAWALNTGVINGYNDNGTLKVEPQMTLTREMAAQIVANASYKNML